MKKVISILIVMMFGVFCGCEADEPFVGPMPVGSEKVVVTVDGKDYEVLVPEKTRFEVSDGAQMHVYTPSLSEGATVDLSGLSGCEYLEGLSVVLSGKNENLILPKLPNLGFCEIFGNDIAFIDASAAEGCDSFNIVDSSPDEIKIGKGPKSISLAYGFDLSMLAGAENIKNITVHGNSDLSKIADIGEVENVYVFGENDSVAGLENLKSLKKLSLDSFGGDLSGIGNLSMQTLAIGSDVTQETVDTLTKSETVTDLHINDEFLTNSDFMEKFPNLEYLVLSVETLPEGTASLDMITEAQLDALETNLPKEPLKDFLKNGGGIYLVYDWSRTGK